MEKADILIKAEADKAQLAQIIMDEGTFRYVRSSRPVHDIHHNEYWGYYPYCMIGKCDEEDIKHFAELLNVEPSLYRKTWTIYFAGEKLLNILMEIKPHFRGEKLPQIEIMLTHGKFYIPNRKTKTPHYLRLVRPEKLMKHLEKRVRIIPIPPKRMSPTPEEIEKMKKLRKQGLSSREIAEIVGYTHPTVLKYTRQTI